VAHEGPVYQRPVARPDTQDALIARSANAATRARIGEPVTVARPDSSGSVQ
jgi:phosphoribosylformylglycinamidine synthase